MQREEVRSQKYRFLSFSLLTLLRLYLLLLIIVQIVVYVPICFGLLFRIVADVLPTAGEQMLNELCFCGLPIGHVCHIYIYIYRERDRTYLEHLFKPILAVNRAHLRYQVFGGHPQDERCICKAIFGCQNEPSP